MLNLIRTIRLAAITLLAALVSTAAHIPVSAQTPALEPVRPLVLVPGLLGSRLCRPGPDGELSVVWGTVASIGEFPSLAMDGTPNTIEPCGLIREVTYLGVYTQEVYSPLIKRLESAGYKEGETLFLFDYDWRLSVFDNAQRLANYVDESIPDDQTIDIVAHSMGGLVELVGVAIETDQPAYQTGQAAMVTVHLSVASRDAVDAGKISITIARPDGLAVPVAFRSDPDASDPTASLEQSFSAQFETGAKAGQLTVTVAIDDGVEESRTVTKRVPVL